MKDGPSIVRIAALIGDHARADVLTALMADRALTATELASIAGVTKQTMSAHLAKLLDTGLLAVERHAIDEDRDRLVFRIRRRHRGSRRTCDTRKPSAGEADALPSRRADCARGLRQFAIRRSCGTLQ